MTWKKVCQLVVTLLWAVTTANILDAGTWAVPGVVNGADTGNHWATEVRIQNRDSKPIGVSLVFWAQGSETASDPSTVAIDPGQTVIYKNVLAEVWRLNDTRGAVMVQTDGAATVTAFRYTDQREAVLGQALQAQPEDEWVSGTSIGDLIWLAQSDEYDSGVWVVLGSDAARAEVIFFDAASVELTRAMVEGSSRSRWLGLADLGIRDQRIVRAQVRFIAGSGAASGEIAHLATGDRMGARAVVAELLQNDLAVHPGMRSASFRTDGRFYNPSKVNVTVNIFWNGKFVNLPLAPGKVLQVDDLAKALALEGDQQGVIRIFSGIKIVALTRVVRLNDDGSLGPGEFLAPDSTIELGGAPVPWTLAGIPAQADMLFLSLRGSPAASGSNVTFADQTGAGYATLPGPLPLAANAQRLEDLLQLAGLPALAPGGTVSIEAQTGQVAPAILGVLHGSGDVTYTTPARTVADTACVGPVIIAFDADRKTLESPGSVVFTWRTAQAASTFLSLDGQIRQASGSANANVSTSSTVTLTASNSCGDVTRDLTIAVGLPSLSQAQVPGQPDASGGSPGQLVRFTVTSLSEPSRVTSLLFQAPGGLTAAASVERVDTQGRLYALVPYIWVDGPARYVQGDVQVSVVWDDGRNIGALPFRILPLTLPANPITIFRDMLKSLEEMAATANVQLRSQQIGSLADAQKVVVAADLAALRQLADDVTAKGSGALFYSNTTTGDNALSATITQQDLAELMAYELNVRDAERQMILPSPTDATTKAAMTRGASDNRDAGRTCLADKERLIPFCQALQYRKKLEAAAADRATEFVKQFTTGIPPNLAQQGTKAIDDWVKARLAKMTMFAVLKRMESYLQLAEILCLVWPIELDHFWLNTQPRPNKEVKYTVVDSQNTRTTVQVNANLLPHYDSNNIRDKLIEKEAKYILEKLGTGGLPSPFAEAVLGAFLKAAQGDVELKLVEMLAKGLHAKSSQDIQVGYCDLFNFYPFPPGGKHSVRLASNLQGEKQGEDNFFYLGTKINTPATMCIIPNKDHFIFSDKVEEQSKKKPRIGCAFSDMVKVKSTARAAADTDTGVFLLPDFTDDVQVGPSEGLLKAGAWTGAGGLSSQVVRPAGYTFSLTDVTDGAPWVQEQSSGLASVRVVIRKVAKNKWEIEGSANGETMMGPSEFQPIIETADLNLDTLLTIPVNRSGTYTLKLDATAQTITGICGLGLSLKSASKIVGGNNGTFVTPSSPRVLTYSLVAENDYGSAGISIGLYASGPDSDRFGKMSCKAKGTIELIIPE